MAKDLPGELSDEELVRVCEEFRGGILDHPRYGGESKGMCFAISSALGGYLSFALDLECRLVQGEYGKRYVIEHWWLELPDGRVLDPTADQFSSVAHPMPKVYIGPKPRRYREIA
jgi:hypothetical protein